MTNLISETMSSVEFNQSTVELVVQRWTWYYKEGCNNCYNKKVTYKPILWHTIINIQNIVVWLGISPYLLYKGKSQVILRARDGHVVSRDKLPPNHLVKKSQRAFFQLPFVIFPLAHIPTFEVHPFLSERTTCANWPCSCRLKLPSPAD
jgi:hypothetical protein